MTTQPHVSSGLGTPSRDFLNIPETPAFVYREGELRRAASMARRVADDAGCTLLYSIKSCGFVGVLETVAPHVSGFGTSSLFEAQLARGVLGSSGGVHTFTVGVKPPEIEELASLSDYMSLNSLSQLSLYGQRIRNLTRCGLRINPGLSFVEDERYDPCRWHSKLGAPIDRVLSVERADHGITRSVDGLHFHTNCDSADFRQLLATVRHIVIRLDDVLAGMEWINLGGGYLFEDGANLSPLFEAVELLRSRYGLRVFIEPGAGIVRESGYLVSTVLDIFDSDGMSVAVLDTTVNHMPEVFEYQFSPDVIGHRDDGKYEYMLAGCSCLAGDLFGEYAFDEPLEIGSRVVFSGMGAYTLPKANIFNGINLPAVFALTEDGRPVLKKRYTSEDFLSHSGVDASVAV